MYFDYGTIPVVKLVAGARARAGRRAHARQITDWAAGGAVTTEAIS